MRLGDLVGHERPVALLWHSLLSGRVSNAYLFVGEDGLGKSSAAQAFAHALLCEQPDSRPAEGVHEACGRCTPCLLAQAGNHPHLRVIAPDGERIKIEQMRELRHDVSLTSFGGARRVYIILGAEAMTEESANCILKTLEEPPPGVTLILVTHSPSRLLPTILSRCQMVRFRAVPVTAVESLLIERHGVEPQRARFIASFSGGRAGWAVRAAQQPAILDARERMLQLLSRLPDAPPVFAFRAAEELRALARELGAQAHEEDEAAETEHTGASAEDRQVRAHAGVLLDIARAWFRDLLVLKLAQDLPLVNVDRQEDLRAVAPRYTIARIQDALQALSRARLHLSRNANVPLSLEVMMARLTEHRAAP